jgi:hypothetical protein
MNGSTWEGNVGPNGTQNRQLTLSKTDQALPVAYFNNVSSIPTIISLTFQVDLAVQIAQGKFDPAAGTVSVAGDAINNWDTSASPMTKSTANTNLWVTTLDVTNASGGILLYKFVLNGSTWESRDNRSYTLTSTNAQTVPTQFFDDIGDLGRLTIGPVSAGQSTVSWTAGPLIRLQSVAALGTNSWQDVPNTLGQSSAKITLSGGQLFYRLIGP